MDTPPFALHGLDHIVLRVVDLDRMRSFYKEVLGCTDEREQPEIGLYQLRAGHALIDLITIAGKLGAMGGAAPGTGGRNLDHFALALDGFDDAEIRAHPADRKSVVSGKMVSVRVDLGGRRIIKKQKKQI